MSRVGRKPIVIPDKVKIEAKGRNVKVTGPLGVLDGIMPEGVDIKIEGNKALVQKPDKGRLSGAFQGTVRALINNMVNGVTKGYERSLEINGVGYKCEPKGNVLTFTLGYTHPIHLTLPAGIKAEVDKNQTKITIKGLDKQMVGLIAAKIRSYKKPEPYQGKGVKYATEVIKRKVGKTGAK